MMSYQATSSSCTSTNSISNQLYTPVATPPPLELHSLSKQHSQLSSHHSMEYSQILPHQMNAAFAYDTQNPDPSIIGLKLVRADSASSWVSSYPPTPDSITPRSSTPVVSCNVPIDNSRIHNYDSPSYITVETILPDYKNIEGKFPCSICNRPYKHIKHLRRHMMRHTGERPYGCDWCSSRFTRADIRKRHVSKCKVRLNVEEPSSPKKGDNLKPVPVAIQMHRDDRKSAIRPKNVNGKSLTSEHVLHVVQTTPTMVSTLTSSSSTPPISSSTSLQSSIVQPAPWRTSQQFQYTNQVTGNFTNYDVSEMSNSPIIPTNAPQMYYQPSPNLGSSLNSTKQFTPSPNLRQGNTFYDSIPVVKADADEFQKRFYQGPHLQPMTAPPQQLSPFTPPVYTNSSLPIYQQQQQQTAHMTYNAAYIPPPSHIQRQVGLGIYVNEHEIKQES